MCQVSGSHQGVWVSLHSCKGVGFPFQILCPTKYLPSPATDTLKHLEINLLHTSEPAANSLDESFLVFYWKVLLSASVTYRNKVENRKGCSAIERGLKILLGTLQRFSHSCGEPVLLLRGCRGAQAPWGIPFLHVYDQVDNWTDDKSRSN